MKNFELFLQDKFSEFEEIDGIPITKDNCEDLFSNWCESLDAQELIDFGEEHGYEQFREGQKVAHAQHEDEPLKVKSK